MTMHFYPRQCYKPDNYYLKAKSEPCQKRQSTFKISLAREWKNTSDLSPSSSLEIRVCTLSALQFQLAFKVAMEDSL